MGYRDIDMLNPDFILPLIEAPGETSDDDLHRQMRVNDGAALYSRVQLESLHQDLDGSARIMIEFDRFLDGIQHDRRPRA